MLNNSSEGFQKVCMLICLRAGFLPSFWQGSHFFFILTLITFRKETEALPVEAQSAESESTKDAKTDSGLTPSRCFTWGTGFWMCWLSTTTSKSPAPCSRNLHPTLGLGLDYSKTRDTPRPKQRGSMGSLCWVPFPKGHKDWLLPGTGAAQCHLCHQQHCLNAGLQADFLHSS